MGCYFLLQGIFPTQGSNLCLLHWQVDSFTTEPPGKPCSLFWAEFISQNDVIAKSYLVCEDPGHWFSRCHLVNFLLETQNPTLTNSLWVKWEGFILWLWEGCLCVREKDEGERKSVNMIRNLGHGIGNEYLHSQWIFFPKCDSFSDHFIVLSPGTMKSPYFYFIQRIFCHLSVIQLLLCLCY